MKTEARWTKWRAALAACLSYVLLAHAVLSASSLAPNEIELRPDLAALYTVCAGDDDGSFAPALPHRDHHAPCALCASGHCGPPALLVGVALPALIAMGAIAPPRSLAWLVIPSRPEGAARPRGPPSSA